MYIFNLNCTPHRTRKICCFFYQIHTYFIAFYNITRINRGDFTNDRNSFSRTKQSKHIGIKFCNSTTLYYNQVYFVDIIYKIKWQKALDLRRMSKVSNAIKVSIPISMLSNKHAKLIIFELYFSFPAYIISSIWDI